MSKTSKLTSAAGQISDPEGGSVSGIEYPCKFFKMLVLETPL
jgi:hypothetical protein